MRSTFRLLTSAYSVASWASPDIRAWRHAPIGEVLTGIRYVESHSRQTAASRCRAGLVPISWAWQLQGGPAMFKNVLAGVDEGEGGRDAIALARVLLAPDGELTLAHVVKEDPLGARIWSDPTIDSRREDARQLLEHAAADAGVQPHIRWLGATSVGRGLHEVAEAIDADLLVVGSSRRGLL